MDIVFKLFRGYVDYFLSESQIVANGNNNVSSDNTSNYTDKQLIVTLIDFFTGGSGTMSKTLAFAIYYCLRNPGVARKIQAELDRETCDQDHVTLDDKTRLVYTEATLLEVARLGSVLPIAPPRMCSDQVKIGTWTIPRGGKVQMNLYALHRNKEHWGDPHVFRPDRFISDGKIINVSFDA